MRRQKLLSMVKVRLLAWLTVIAALTAAVSRDVNAEPVSWQHLCHTLGNFAGVLTDYRNRGANEQDAVAAAYSEFPITTDRVVAAEVARQVYATPGLNREQEVTTIYIKCITPTKGQSHAGPRAIVQITDLESIPLRPGSNHIARFAADGRDANVTLTWRDEDKGHGQDVFQVMMPRMDGTGWRSVGLLQSKPWAAGGAMADDPHEGDDMFRSLRFAHGKVNNVAATLLLVASRAEHNGSGPSDATYDVYQLVQSDGRDGFERIVQQVAPGRICNADMALTVASGLPLRSSYRGPRDANGDFTKDGCRGSETMARRSPVPAASGLASSAPVGAELSKAEEERLFQQFSDSGKARR